MDESVTFDRATVHASDVGDWQLPESAAQALVRGAIGRCPSCGQTRFFPKLLKPLQHCPTCHQDWTPQQADDFPAYLAILVTGHIMAPMITAVVINTDLPLWANMAIIVSMAIVLIGLLLQPAKGAIIAFQWWMGMHGFDKPDRKMDLSAGK